MNTLSRLQHLIKLGFRSLFNQKWKENTDCPDTTLNIIPVDESSYSFSIADDVNSKRKILENVGYSFSIADDVNSKETVNEDIGYSFTVHKKEV